MKGKKLMNIIGNIEDKYIIEAEPQFEDNHDTTSDRRPMPMLKYISVAVCFILIVTIVLLDNWSEERDAKGLLPPKISTHDNVSLNSGAVYHDVDASQLIRQISSVKVPHGFFFNNRLIELVRINPGITNNGVGWEEQKYTKDDIESALQISVKDPDLPAGDYTISQYVLVDKATENIIAYQTVYYYFYKDTMELKNRFSIFYFPEQYFKSDGLQQMKNVSITNGKVNMCDFPQPMDVHAKVPLLRKLVYLNNGISIVMEGETDFVQKDGVIDKEKSLERYKQMGKQLVNIMKSLI